MAGEVGVLPWPMSTTSRTTDTPPDSSQHNIKASKAHHQHLRPVSLSDDWHVCESCLEAAGQSYSCWRDKVFSFSSYLYTSLLLLKGTAHDTLPPVDRSVNKWHFCSVNFWVGISWFYIHTRHRWFWMLTSVCKHVCVCLSVSNIWRGYRGHGRIKYLQVDFTLR